MALAITDSNFEELLASGKPVVVDFWATWCGPCKKIGPDIEALAEEYKEQAVIGKCDVEENDGLAMRFGVRNVPTVIFIKNGEVVDKQVGAAPKSTFEEKLKAILAPDPRKLAEFFDQLFQRGCIITHGAPPL